jgi:hypothetical protein
MMIASIPKFPIIQKKMSDNFTNLCNTNIVVVKEKWGSIINTACGAYGVDPNLMIGFILIESPDVNPNAISGASAIGLMQMQVPTAWDYLSKQAPKMPAGYALVVQRVLPGLLKPGGFTGFFSSWKGKMREALFDPEFNLWTGITGITQMIWADMQKNNGKLRMDHVIIKYNAGGDDYSGNYHKYVITPGLKDADPATLLANMPLSETRAYLIKYLGIDGSVVVAINNS